MIDRALAHFPSLEVAVRLAYWRIEPLHMLGNAIRGMAERRPVSQVDFSLKLEEVLSALRGFGIAEGDVLIVHSAFSALRPTGLSPVEVVRTLKSFVGDAGTLAMPSMPQIEHEPQGLAKFDDAAYEQIFEFDLRSDRIITGALPRALLTAPAAVRSRHPGNNMVALGPSAAAIMEGNLEGSAPSPCGPHSSWAHCYRLGAKIVALGVDLVHSLTMIHVAEEAFPGWPVPGWFRERRYRVRDENFDQVVTVRERRHEWSQHYAERAFSRDLYVAGVAKSARIGGLDIHFCAAADLVDFLRGHPRVAYPYVFPFGVPREPTQ